MFILVYFSVFMVFFKTASFQKFDDVRNFKLYDILKPSDTHRFFDTLQYEVEEQYSDSHLSFDVSTLYNYAEKPISIEKLNKRYSDVLYQGDMAISYKQLAKLVNGTVESRRKRFFKQKVLRDRRQAYVDEDYPSTIWQNGVPFVLHSSLNSDARASILRAIHFWYKETCIEFMPRTTQSEYLLFVGNDDGCWSTVGRDDSLPQQVVSIPEGCEAFGVTSHELAHALGLFHEQSRYDRDAYVTFNPRVVDRTLLFNFAIVPPDQLSTYGLPYDIGSVMHYTPTEFSLFPNIPSLTAVDSNLQQTMGQFEGPSFLDVNIMNRHYKCSNRCRTPLPPCKNGGFVNSRNCRVCKCPSGFGGDYCDTVAPSFSNACGGVLTAREVARKFDMTIRQSDPNNIREKMCIYHIKAPAGKKILVDILSIQSQCVEGCWQNAMELKMRRDIRPVGYRFCCPESRRKRIVSDTNLVPFFIFSRTREISISIQFSYIDAFASLDDESAVESNEIIERSRNEADGVSSSISEFPVHSLLRILGKR